MGRRRNKLLLIVAAFFNLKVGQHKSLIQIQLITGTLDKNIYQSIVMKQWSSSKKDMILPSLNDNKALF